MDPLSLQECSYILIRHGLSEINYQRLLADKKFGKGSDQAKELRYALNYSLVDPELHPIGFLQCEAQHEVVNSIDWQVVFVSPMQRTLMTAIHMFKEHPNKGGIQFIVLPLVTEVIQYMSDTCIDCFELIEKFGEGKDITEGIKFDFSMLYNYKIP